MSTAVEPIGAATAGGSVAPDAVLLERGLAIAARSRGLTFVAFPADVVGTPQLVDAWRDAPTATWSSADLTIVGIGIARELRARGASRFDDLAAAARGVIIGGAAVNGIPATVAQLGFARPRFLGGAAFVPGAADAAPWTGFGDAWFVLPRWTYVAEGARAMLVLAVASPGFAGARSTAEQRGDTIDGANVVDAARFARELGRWREALAMRYVARPQPALREVRAGDTVEWTAQVESITAAIARGECSKIVAARTCTVELADGVRCADLLAALDARHADCVRVMMAPTPGAALVAATPERLVRVTGDRVECDALAGTIANGEAAALCASDKDGREHAIVVDAIVRGLAAVGAEVAVGERGVRALRHVLHLHTPIAGKLARARHVLELVGRLHPTPAMGGTPTNVAVAWIAEREPAPRGWYASPVGWFDLDGDGEMAVAIRAGVVSGARAHLWAGAGIVSGSDPAKELAETEAKLRAMLGALGVAG